MVRILIADDSALVRSHIRAMLEQRSGWAVVSEACNGHEALEKCQEHPPDLMVMDFQMPEMNGLEAARRLARQQPELPILMVTVDPSRQLETEAQRAGIKGLCPKSRILLDAAEALLKGDTYFPLGWAPTRYRAS